MSLSPEIKQACEQQLKLLFAHAAKLIAPQVPVWTPENKKQQTYFEMLGVKSWRCPTLKEPTLVFTQRGKIAGSAVLQKNIIKLHPTLLSNNLKYYLEEVIAHELSHILVYQLFGQYKGLFKRTRVKPHGIEWQTMMTDIFNVPAKVTHQLDVRSVSMRGFDYRCKCQTIELSLIRHNKVLRGKQVYYCKRCNQPFEKLGQVVTL